MRTETFAEKQLRLQIEARCREVGAELAGAGLPGTGFALFMFDFGPGGALAYVANGRRADVRRLLVEWLERTAEPGDPDDRGDGPTGD